MIHMQEELLKAHVYTRLANVYNIINYIGRFTSFSNLQKRRDNKYFP